MVINLDFLFLYILLNLESVLGTITKFYKYT